MSELSYVVPNTVPIEAQAGYTAAAALALSAHVHGSELPRRRDIAERAGPTAWAIARGMEENPREDVEGHVESSVDVAIGAIDTLNRAAKGADDPALLRRTRMIFRQFLSASVLSGAR